MSDLDEKITRDPEELKRIGRFMGAQELVAQQMFQAATYGVADQVNEPVDRFYMLIAHAKCAVHHSYECLANAVLQQTMTLDPTAIDYDRKSFDYVKAAAEQMGLDPLRFLEQVKLCFETYAAQTRGTDDTGH